MRIISSFLPFLFYFYFLFLEVNSVWVTWFEEHDRCTANLQIEKNQVIENSPFACEKAPYYIYFSNLLKNPPSEYHKHVANEIINMYSELKLRLKPTQVTIQRMNGEFETINVHPITFAIPEENIVTTVPPKLKPFGRVIPGVQSTYYHLYNESDYFADMKKSLFVLTYKKGGWDCLRHYEILAAGSLPLFPDIGESPSHALVLHPKKLYQLFLKQPGLDLTGHRTGRMTIKFDRMEMNLPDLDRELYTATVMAMLQYTRNIFSTKSMAKYVLDTMYEHSQGKIQTKLPRKIFYLTHQDHDMDKGDYMTDFLLHGLITLLGEQPIVTDFPSRNCLYKTTNEFNETDYLNKRLHLYGSGFSWGLKIDVLSSRIDRNQEEIERNLKNHEYDVIILGSGHRDGWASKLLFWDLICQYYSPYEVGYIDGADNPLKRRLLEKYSSCAGHLFSREGYSSSGTGSGHNS
jgi:hypothetical protein